ncbi:MAG: diaminopimelate decarboxylase [Gammaproteobacteria bacterium]|nr:diaminopimelate decarboxylase [Gammaproteobacteria bacterium]
MFGRRDNAIGVEDVPLAAIADAVGTPAYVYSRAVIEDRYRRLSRALAGGRARICYAVKANANLAILRLMLELGAGFDIVSAGELQRVLRAGGAGEDVVFSGVGKSVAEIDFALKVGIRCFNVESEAELERLEARARLLSRVAPVSVRVNPDVDAGTHPYISTGRRENKFGVAEGTALDMYRRAAGSHALEVRGIDCHIGSQVLELGPYAAARDRLLGIVDTLAAEGISIDHVDLGGGFAVPYDGEPGLDVETYGREVAAGVFSRGLELIVEPGRYLVAEAGVLLTRVEYLKRATREGQRNFAVVDAAMNDLLRPALYEARHAVEAVEPNDAAPLRWDVVGPVCETGDFLAMDRDLALTEGALLAVFGAGAYGMVLSSNYNGRGRAPEVLVSGGEFRVVRRRETLGDQLALEGEGR